MVAEEKTLYACCPVCTKPIGKSKRIDGMEMPCPKCGTWLKITIDEQNKVVVELPKEEMTKEK